MQVMFKSEENHFDTCLLEETDNEGQPCAEPPEEIEKLICLNPDLGYDEPI